MFILTVSFRELLGLVIGICIFLILRVEPTISQPSSTSTACILNLRNVTSWNNSTCEEGTWGGFLSNNCCKGGFHEYLYALAQRANQTGQIYLDPTEQRNCLIKLKGKSAIMSCGIEKLTSGAGGCSDFSVADVTNRFGHELQSLKQKCEVSDLDGRSCGSCVKSWEDIKEQKPYEYAQPDICRFAVLVSLTSTATEDLAWILNIYKCLGKQNSGKATEARKDPWSKDGRGIHMLIGGLIGITAALVLSIYVFRRRWYTSHAPAKQDGLKRALPKKSRYLKVPLREVLSATNNLNQMNFIGEGTAGKVYKGVLSKKHVAVKHIIDDGFMETFLREVKNLWHVRHPNLVALLGYCDNENECFLIYELCPNGNLSEWLFGTEKILSWIQRLEISIDCARGLWFLHTYPEGCIVHRDIKPTNILLGSSFEAKLSDFGLSKAIEIGETYASSEVRGTFGYVDPEYHDNHQVNSAGDVYSFGIVLLQILSGRKVINMNMKKPMPIDKMAKLLARDSSIKFADPKLEGEYSAEAFDRAFKLALKCTGLKQQRPSMEQVVARLEELHDISMSGKASTPRTTPNWSDTP